MKSLGFRSAGYNRNGVFFFFFVNLFSGSIFSSYISKSMHIHHIISCNWSSILIILLLSNNVDACTTVYLFAPLLVTSHNYH